MPSKKPRKCAGFLTRSQVCRLLGICSDTLLRWNRSGRLVPVARTPGNFALYSLEQVQEFAAKVGRTHLFEVVRIVLPPPPVIVPASDPAGAPGDPLAPDVESHLRDYEQYLFAKEVTRHHIAQTLTSLRKMMDGCAYRTLADLAASLRLGTWLRKQRERDTSGIVKRESVAFGQRTSNFYLRAMRTFARWLMREGRLQRNDFERVATVRVTEKKRRRRALTAEEAARLLQATAKAPEIMRLSGPDRVMLYRFALLTGLRAGECASVTPRSFCFTANPPTLTVLARDSKHKREDVLPLHADLVQALQPWLVGRDPSAKCWPGRTWSKRAGMLLAGDLERAKIPVVNERGEVVDFHALRHTYASSLAIAGVHPSVAMMLMRHSNIALTMQLYTHRSISEAHAALQQVRLPTAADSLSPDKSSQGRADTKDT